MDYNTNSNPVNNAQPVVPQTSLQPPQNYSKKNLWKWILLCVLIGVIAYSAIYYFAFYKNGGNHSSLETADWKTYANTFGYKFEYPDHVSLDSIDYGNKDLSIDSSKRVNIWDKNANKVIFNIDNYPSLENLSPEYIKNQYGGVEKQNMIITSIQIEDVSGYKINFGNLSGYDHYFFEQFEQIFNMGVLKNNETAQKMFSTFKFTSPSAPIGYPIDWQSSDDRSEHVGSKMAIFPINGKELSWPVIKNISNPQVADKINKILDFNRNIEFTNFDATEHNGIAGISFEVNYDRNNILSLTLYVSNYGAYPDESVTNYLINLANGETIKLSDIFYQNKINELIDVLNTKLQNNVKQKFDSAYPQKPGSCLAEDVNYDLSRSKFTEKNIDYKITSVGINFIYDFGFPHVIQACEPSGVVALSHDQLKDYINPNGLLGNEIK